MRILTPGLFIRTLFAFLAMGFAGAGASAATAALRTAAHAADSAANFSCTGNVHARVIAIWQHVARPYFAQQIDVGLNRIHEVYVLYNVQEEAQDFVEMTRRCKDGREIDQLAATLEPAFHSLQPLPGLPHVQGWVCSGGHTCTSANHLLGTEVQLVSAQFLGLIGAVATDIVENVPEPDRTPAERTFLTSAATAMAIQVNHWLSPSYFQHTAQRMSMKPADDKTGSSSYFFEDRDLWFMTTLSDLSELHQADVDFTPAATEAFQGLQAKDPGIASLFNLFLKRLTLIPVPDGLRAEIDRGFARNLAEYRYARYSAAESPVRCRKEPSGRLQSTLQVPPQPLYRDPAVGWDTSHARRLVPALSTFVRNSRNIRATFDYSNPDFDPIELQRAFAAQLVGKIWSKNSQYPLFTNFWDGNNGWYRAGYDNGTGACASGTPPWGLSWSVPTGGYLAWGTFDGALRAIGERLYQLLYAKDAKSREFIDRYYPQIAAQGPSGAAMSNTLWRFTMLSSLVE